MSTAHRSRWMKGNLALVLAFLVTTEAHGQTITGTADLQYREVTAIAGCGKDPWSGPLSVTVAPDGTFGWEGPVLALGTGTYAPVGNSGRKFDLTLDEESLSDFVDELELAAGAFLCYDLEWETLTAPIKKRSSLKLNKKQTRAVLRIKYLFRVTTSGGILRKGRYSLKAKGPWIPQS